MFYFLGGQVILIMRQMLHGGKINCVRSALLQPILQIRPLFQIGIGNVVRQVEQGFSLEGGVHVDPRLAQISQCRQIVRACGQPRCGGLLSVHIEQGHAFAAIRQIAGDVER